MAELLGPRLYSCCNCRNHVAFHDDIISKAFQVMRIKSKPFVLFFISLRLIINSKSVANRPEESPIKKGLLDVCIVFNLIVIRVVNIILLKLRIKLEDWNAFLKL